MQEAECVTQVDKIHYKPKFDEIGNETTMISFHIRFFLISADRLQIGYSYIPTK